MISYENEVLKALKKKKIPDRVFLQFHNSFLAILNYGDFSIFDIKKMKGDFTKDYYRIRKGNYRAIFYIETKKLYVISLGSRKDVYKSWE